VNAAKPILLISLFFCTGNTFAQSSEKEPAAVVEFGAAASRSLTQGQSSFGPTVAVEATPIENWLELEAGVTPLFRRHSTEWSIDLLFKKPWTLSDKVEFMLGVAPSGFIRTHTALQRTQLPLKSHQTLCFGRPGTDSAGILSRVTSTSSGPGMNIRSV
jgi:hypothetical protein